MAKEYLLVDGKLVKADTKLVQVPDVENLNDLADENGAYATQSEEVANEIEELIVKNGVIDGSPKDVYANLSALQTAFPSGTSGVYITSDNGHWHYWNGSAWTDGGVYQTDLRYDDIKYAVKTNLLKADYNYEANSISPTGENSIYNLRGRTSDYVKFNSKIVKFDFGDNYAVMIFEYDENKNFIFSTKEYQYGSFYWNVDENHFYRWMIRDSSNGEFTTFDLSKCKVYEYGISYMQLDLSDYPFENYSSLNKAVDDYKKDNFFPIFTGVVEVGTIVDGSNVNNDNRFRTRGLIDISKYSKLRINNISSGGTQYIDYYDENKTWLNKLTKVSIGNLEYIPPQGSHYARLLYGGTAPCGARVLNELSLYGFVTNSSNYATIDYVNEKVDNISYNELNSSYASECDNVRDAIISKQKGNTFSFAFITDLHLDYTKDNHIKMYNQICKSIRKLSNNANLSFVAFGGDNTENLWLSSGPSRVEQIKNTIYVKEQMLSNLRVPLLIATGNHDDNSIRDNSYNGQTLNKDNQEHIPTKSIYDYELYNYYCKFNENSEVVFGGEDKMYYYIDLPKQKVRVFVLNSIDIPYDLTTNNTLKYTGQWTYGYRNEQLNFVANSLKFADKSNPSEWSTIFIKHMSINPTYFADGNMNNNDILVGIIKAYINGTSYVANKTDGDFPYSINVNYNGVTGTVISDIVGHQHVDASGTYDGIPYILTTTARFTSRNDSADNVQNTAFDIFTVNLDDKKIYATRFGYGEDREINF